MTQPIEAIERIVKIIDKSLGFIKVHNTLDGMMAIDFVKKGLAKAIWEAIEIDKEILRDIIVKHTSEMLDNPDEYGIYPTTKFYNNLIDALAKEKVVVIKEGR